MFDLDAFDIKLNTEVIGRNFVYSDEIDSTNSYLLDKGNKNNINGTVVFAEKQNKGKGRKDRVWYSAKGQNLTFSILINDQNLLKDKYNIINFASSLSVCQAIENLYQLNMDLKWPNDVLVNGKKIAGILLESSSSGSKMEKLVIGIGLNINQALFQGVFNIEPTSIKVEMNQSVERERILAEILNIFEENLARVEDSPADILKDWKQRCKMIGEKISITDGENVKYGIFDDIDDNGFLLLKNRARIEKIHFGDVSLG